MIAPLVKLGGSYHSLASPVKPERNSVLRMLRRTGRAIRCFLADRANLPETRAFHAGPPPLGDFAYGWAMPAAHLESRIRLREVDTSPCRPIEKGQLSVIEDT